MDSLQGHAGEDWSPCTHMKKYGLNFPTFFARVLAFHIKPSSSLEFGCGLGTMSDFVARFTPGGRTTATCIEPTPMLREIFRNRQWPQRPEQLAVNIFDKDAQQCKIHLTDKKFDLVMSFEVLEHIEFEHHPSVLRFLAESTRKYLFFSAAREGQGGHGHISLRSKDNYASEFEQLGLVRMPNLEYFARYAARQERSYDIFSNLVVMRNPRFEVEDPQFKDIDTWMAGLEDFYPYRYPRGDDAKKNAATKFIKGTWAALWPELAFFQDNEKRPCRKV